MSGHACTALDRQRFDEGPGGASMSRAEIARTPRPVRWDREAFKSAAGEKARLPLPLSAALRTGGGAFGCRHPALRERNFMICCYFSTAAQVANTYSIGAGTYMIPFVCLINCTFLDK